VQGPGAALRIGTKALCREVARSSALRRVLHTYLYVLMAQLATSSACVRYHEIGPRLARWLLMTGDRAGSETFRVTHELLAHMLGVRRVGITVAARALQSGGLIAYRRGVLSIVDRHALEAAACSCYAADSSAYSHFLGDSFQVKA
jgi:CRP-like cAMP-binding protein